MLEAVFVFKKTFHPILTLFVEHKVAANLLMMVMVVLGAFSIWRMNIQFLPNLNINYITISIPWPGASATDVEKSLIVPLEKPLRNLPELKKMRSQARANLASIVIEFKTHADMSAAFQNVQQRVAAVDNLPPDSERPIINKVERYEPIAKLLISGPKSKHNLRKIAYQYEQQLLSAGIAKIEINGLGEQEFALEVSQEKLHSLGLSLPDIAQIVQQHRLDAPLGTVGRSEGAKALRIDNAVRSIDALAGIPLVTSGQQVVYLNDIATVTLRNKRGEKAVFYQGKPAVELQVFRSKEDNALTMANILHSWVAKTQASQASQGIQLTVYDQTWTLIKGRINLLLKNGLTGLVFIVIVLMLFLNRRVAFWVAIGIPVSCFAAFFLLDLFGGTINMISLFAFIMTLGIIVDDTIVVGEQAYQNFRHGQSPVQSVLNGAQFMVKPVLASSLTTVAAFLPLMLVGDVMGQVLFAIPLVVVMVILASLFECFLVLPYHLKQSFQSARQRQVSRFRMAFDAKFDYFRDVIFAAVLAWTIRWRWTVFASCVGLLLVMISVLVGGYVRFTFFKMPDFNQVKLNVVFYDGTSQDKVKQFLTQAEQELTAISARYHKEHPSEPQLVQVVTQVLSQTADLRGDLSSQSGERVGHLNVELSQPDERSISNEQLIQHWRTALGRRADIEKLSISSPQGGPPGQDIDIQLSGASAKNLKQAAGELKSALAGFVGVSNIQDNYPYGHEEWVLKLTPQAIAQGLTPAQLATQVSAGYSRALADRITIGQDDIDITVSLPREQQDQLALLDSFPIKLSHDHMVPLSHVVRIETIQGFSQISHDAGQRAISITAKVDSGKTNANQIVAKLKNGLLAELSAKGLTYRLGGKSEEQKNTFDDLLYGLVIGLFLIYVILALVFSSYRWPWVVMSMIPLGLVGAVLGHWLLGYDMTILSIFGLFGLAGIVINDSIILLSTYRQQLAAGLTSYDAMFAAAKSRLRPVLLTSLTTIAGLMPLLFETSTQAKFLIPMAVSLVFGLLLSTLLILLVQPAMLVKQGGGFRICDNLSRDNVSSARHLESSTVMKDN